MKYINAIISDRSLGRFVKVYQRFVENIFIYFIQSHQTTDFNGYNIYIYIG